MNGETQLFVYGTLRRLANQPMHELLMGRALFVGYAKFRGRLYDLGRFPGVIASSLARDGVIGEVYRLSDARNTLRLLDDYEGKFFRRELREVAMADGKKRPAWIYLYAGPLKSAARIRSGDYEMSVTESRQVKARVRRVVTERELTKAFAIRLRVFVREQHVPAEIELDRDDQRAIHFLATSAGRAVGTARLVIHDRNAKIGRMAVLKSFRRRGIGKRLLERALAAAKKRGVKKIYLHAQVPVIGFYEALDFRCVGPVFDEAGIPHRKMVLKKATGIRQQAIVQKRNSA